MDGSYCIKLVDNNFAIFVGGWVVLWVVGWVGGWVGGWLGGGDALSTDPRLTPSGRLVVYHISSFEYRLQAFCINIRTFKCQRKLRERK